MTSKALAPWLAFVGLVLAPRPARAEFLVNTYTTGSQGAAEVAAGPAGFVVVWESYGQDGAGFGVFGQRYDPMGSPLGGEFQVNVQTTTGEVTPAVAIDSSGGFVVVWTESLDSSIADLIVGRRYDGSGAPLGGEFQVNTYTTGFQADPAIAMDASGDFVVVWSGQFSAEHFGGVRGRRFDSSGVPLDAEFQVNTYTTNSQGSPSVAMQPAGDFVVVWQSLAQLAPSRVALFGRRYDAAGVPLGGEFHLGGDAADSNRYPSVAPESTGGFVVVWEGPSPSSYQDILARRFDAAGVPLAGEFVVNTYSGVGRPRVAADGAGFVVVWEAEQVDFQTDIRGQRYDGGGIPVANEFQINSYTPSSQRMPVVAGDGAGNFVVVWRSDTVNLDVVAQINKPDRLILGRRLQVSDRRGTEDGRTVTVVGTEPSTDVGPTIDGDPTVDGATLRIVANGTTPSDQTFVLDAAGWDTAGAAGFRYAGPTGGDGDPVKRVLVKRAPGGTALVKVLLRGSLGTQPLDIVPPNTGTDGGLVLEIGGGGGRYCVSFGGAAGGNEAKDDASGWRVLRATAEPGCAAP